MDQKHTLCPPTPPPAALRCTNSRRATHKVTYGQPRHCCTLACSCLQQGRTPEMDRCQQGDFWQYQTRFSLLLCYLLLCLHNCNFLCSFYTSQVESFFVPKGFCDAPVYCLLFSSSSVSLGLGKMFSCKVLEGSCKHTLGRQVSILPTAVIQAV